MRPVVALEKLAAVATFRLAAVGPHDPFGPQRISQRTLRRCGFGIPLTVPGPIDAMLSTVRGRTLPLAASGTLLGVLDFRPAGAGHGAAPAM
jgi:hypothetical protein